MEYTLEVVKELAKQYYTDKGFAHANRVAAHIRTYYHLSTDQIEKCVILAYMHDLLEDTAFTLSEDAPEWLTRNLKLLTKPKCETYLVYIKRIRNSLYVDKENALAYWVKLADMQDHLAQVQTLTPKLQAKYIQALPYLL